jgi:hypothetical protein
LSILHEPPVVNFGLGIFKGLRLLFVLSFQAVSRSLVECKQPSEYAGRDILKRHLVLLQFVSFRLEAADASLESLSLLRNGLLIIFHHLLLCLFQLLQRYAFRLQVAAKTLAFVLQLLHMCFKRLLLRCPRSLVIFVLRAAQDTHTRVGQSAKYSRPNLLNVAITVTKQSACRNRCGAWKLTFAVSALLSCWPDPVRGS